MNELDPLPSVARSSAQGAARIREETLRDPRYPVHKISDRLLPYLEVLVDQSQAEQILLFGSYAYGQPDPGSDVDLLIVKDLDSSPLREALRIRKMWRPLHLRSGYLSIHLLIASPERHRHRLAHAAGFYDTINRDGLRLA